MTFTGISVAGKVCVVTGGGGGIGRAVCAGLAAMEAKVVAAEIDPERLAGTVEAVGSDVVGVAADTCDPAGVESMVAAALERFGRIDVLVNTAFVGRTARPEDLSLQDWDLNLRVNLTGYFLSCQRVGRQMIAQGSGGSIVNFSSIAGSSAVGRTSFAYSVCKGGINMMTKELAVEWARFGIRVNAIQPCQVLTPGLEARMKDHSFTSVLDSRILPGIPMGRLGQPDDMVGAVVFLASDAAAMVTGVLLPVDGGNLAMNAGGSRTY